MNAQKYNGWTNRETWCVNLHGFSEAVENRWIHDIFEVGGSICGTYLVSSQLIDRRVSWSELSGELEDEFIATLARDIHADVEHYLEEVVHLDSVFVQDMLPCLSLRGGAVNYWELAEHVYDTIRWYAEHNGWS